MIILTHIIALIIGIVIGALAVLVWAIGSALPEDRYGRNRGK